MASTTISTSDSITRKEYEEKVFREMYKKSYFYTRLVGAGENSIIQENNKLLGVQGDAVTMSLVVRNTGDWKENNAQLENHEQRLTHYNFSLSLTQYRNAIRSGGKLDQKRPAWEMTPIMRERLTGQGAEFIDQKIFDALQLSPTKTFWPGTATSKATLTTADKITPTLLSKVKAWSITGGNRSQPPIRPVQVDGGDYYVCVVHPDVTFDWHENSVWQQAAREALARSEENPLFKGSKFIWNGVVVHESEKIEIFTNGGSGSNVPGANCLFLGAQAGMLAWGSRPVIETETFDYKNEIGYAFDFIAGFGKPKFNSKDFGVVAVQVARTQIADA